MVLRLWFWVDGSRLGFMGFGPLGFGFSARVE